MLLLPVTEEYFPAGQEIHVAEVFCPTPGEYFPVEQGVQEDDPFTTEYFPAIQDIQSSIESAPR
jgi:hypothetical protein